MGSWFCDRLCLNFSRRAINMMVERAVMWVKKLRYFGKFGHMNSSNVRKSITLMFLSSSRDKFTLLKQNLLTDVSFGFRPAFCSSMASTYKSL